jgi:hypothetical protein
MTKEGRTMRKSLILLFALFLIIFPAFAQDTADAVYIRAAHFSVDAPTVDIYVNGELTISSFDFPEVSEWTATEAGSYEVAVVLAGGAVEDAVATGSWDVAAGQWVTLAVVGEAARDSLAIQPLVDDLGNIPDGNFRMSAFNAIPEFEPINVLVGDDEIVHGLAFPASFEENDGYVSTSLLAGIYAVEIQNEAGEAIINLDEITMGEGRAYFVAAVGTRNEPQYVFIPTDVEAVMGVETAAEEVEVGEGPLQLRLGHFVVDAGEVDIYIDGEVVASNMLFGDITDYSEIEAGFYEVALVPAGGALEDAVYTGEIALVANSVTLVAAIGYLDDGTATVVTAPESNTAPASGNMRVSFFQAVPSLNLFDLSIDGSTLIQGVAFPNAFEGAGDGYVSVDLPAGPYSFSVTSGDTTLDVGTITTGAGRSYLIVAAGNEANPVYFFKSADFPAGE